MARRYFSSTAAKVYLATPIGTSDTSITVTATTGYPSSVPFTIALDRGTASEELCDVTAVAGTSWTVTRAVDGTTAKAHAGTSGTVEHVASGRDLDEANSHVNTSHVALTTNAASTQAAGDAATVGTGAAAAKDDHKHAMPAADGAAGTATFRTLGTGATQAAAGNHSHTGVLLAHTSATTGGGVVSSTNTWQDVDSANIAVTFTVPASGAVRLCANFTMNANSTNVYMGFRNGGSVVAGTVAFMDQSGSGSKRYNHVCYVTGLTPGASLTYKLAFQANGTGATVYTGDGGSAINNGPAVLEVWGA